MVRQAQSYLAGAASSAALLAAAIATFVLLASFTAFREWPSLSGFGDSASDTVTSTLVEPPAAAQAAALALEPATALVAATTPAPSGSAVASIDEGLVIPDPAPIGRPDLVIPGPGPDLDPVGLPPIPIDPPVVPPVVPVPDSGTGSGPLGGAVDDVEDTVGGTTEAVGLGNTVEAATETLAGPDTLVGNTVETTVNVLGGTLRGLLGDHSQ